MQTTLYKVAELCCCLGQRNPEQRLTRSNAALGQWEWRRLPASACGLCSGEGAGAVLDATMAMVGQGWTGRIEWRAGRAFYMSMPVFLYTLRRPSDQRRLA